MDLLLVRHGLPERIEGGEGPADPVLTDEGRRQSERLADWLRVATRERLLTMAVAARALRKADAAQRVADIDIAVAQMR